MYESIQGVLVEKEPTIALIDLQGLTYKLLIPLNTYNALPELGSTVKLFLSYIVREDAHLLFAFHTKEHRALFETLITISGIGPKTAAAILGHLELSTLKSAIRNADIASLSKIPGIGKKTAERLALELKDRVKNIAPSLSSPLEEDAVRALVHLGYKSHTAGKAVEKAQKNKPTQNLGSLVTEALRQV